jgi:steroid delta-isomerase-like uncharacterized protein
MSNDELKGLGEKWLDAVNRHDVEAAVALCAEDIQNHAATAEAQGASGIRTIMTKLLQAFPDLRYHREDLLADGDRVVMRVKMTGTNTGPLAFSRFPLPASGKSFETEQIHIMRVANGKFVEHWVGRDDVGMMRQLGHLPAPPAKA